MFSFIPSPKKRGTTNHGDVAFGQTAKNSPQALTSELLPKQIWGGRDETAFVFLVPPSRWDLLLMTTTWRSIKDRSPYSAEPTRWTDRRTAGLLVPCPITHSAVGGPRQTAVQPSGDVRVRRQVQAPHFAPDKDARHIEVGDAKFAARQAVAVG